MQEGKSMRRHIVILGISFLLLSLYLSGCDQLIIKPDHVSVNIMVAVNIVFLDADNNIIQKNTDAILIIIVIQKNGRDRLVFERFMQNGLCQATGDFELSTGGFIECTADVKDENQMYNQVFQGYAKLTWETVNATTNFGGVYNWYPKITITLKE